MSGSRGRTGFRKDMIPLEGPLRVELEEWLNNGGYEEMKASAYRPFYNRSAKESLEVVHNALERACRASLWKDFDPTKSTVRDQVIKKILWQAHWLHNEARMSRPPAYSYEDYDGKVSPRDEQLKIDLEEAIGSLTEPYRDIFHSIEVEGHYAKDVAVRYGVTKQRIGQILKKAKAILRRKLAAYDNTGSQQGPDSTTSDLSLPRAA